MINNTLTNRDFLSLFNLILSKGIKIESTYELSGIQAWSDFDGYTCWLSYKDLTITLLFHSKFDVDFEKKETFEEFYKKANSLIALS